ncbi:hypothetical protein AM231_19215 [Paenibacillus solani]|uniref:Uncharacterized protein n=1 Tax=Paenibacillus solani TaxID=1705565 RepID=A0A0M1NK99_9BACL|nr:hypothetical protein AM231_19215 [Paenibacillus solani]
MQGVLRTQRSYPPLPVAPKFLGIILVRKKFGGKGAVYQQQKSWRRHSLALFPDAEDELLKSHLNQ